MFLSQKLKILLFNKECIINGKELTGRRVDITFPAKDDDDKTRIIKFAADDGLILHLIKRIEALEEALGKSYKVKADSK